MASEKTQTESPKWWIDQTRVSGEERKQSGVPPAVARFYVAAKGFEQERARSGLVDLNLKLLMQGDPADGDLALLRLIDEKSPSEIVDKVKRALPLPAGARGVIVDAGKSLRAIVTGAPVGERILEFNFNRGEPSFDAWIRNDWQEEIVFRNVNDLYRRARGLIDRYLGAEALAKPEFLT